MTLAHDAISTDRSDESLAVLGLGTALTGELDLDRLTQRLTDEVRSVIGAEMGALFFEGERGPRAVSGVALSETGAPSEATFRAGTVERVADVRAHPRLRDALPFPVASYLAVPLVGHRKVIGGLVLGHREPNRFTERDERLALAIAAHAAVALENARLFGELRARRDDDERAARHAELAAEIGALLTRAGPFTALLRDCAGVLARHADIGVARIWVSEGGELRLWASAGEPEQERRVVLGHDAAGVIGRAAHERRVIAKVDGDDALPAVADPTMRCLAGLPLESDDTLVGVLGLRSREPLTTSVLESLRPVASLLGLGIQRAQEQERVRVSELKHRLAADASNEGIWFLDVATNAVEWNDRLFEMLGAARDAGDDGSVARFARVHPEDRARLEAAMQAHLTRREPYEVRRFRMQHASGEYRVFNARGQAEWSASGAPLHMAGSVVDVTAKVRAEEALAASEHRYRQILDSVRDMVFCKTPDSRVVYANAAACAHYGVRSEELIGEVDGPSNEPELTAKYVGDDRAVFETGAVVEDMEEENVRHDGEHRYFHVVKSPVRDRNGRVVQLVGVARDVTERRRLEDDQRFLGEASSLLASSIEYEVTFANLARLTVPRFADWCALDVLDERGEIRRVAVEHVDPAKVQLAHDVARRWPPDPNAETGVPAVIRHGRSEVYAEIPDSLLEAGIPDRELLAIIRELGLRSSMCVPLTVHGKTLGALTLISAESGRLYDASAVALAEDLARRAAVAVEHARLYAAARRAIDERDRALATVQRFNAELERRVDERTRALAEMNRELESFSYTVSHDLRAPIRHISGFVDLVSAHAGDALDDKSKRWLRTIGDASKQMGTLIDALLAFSRMGRMALGRDEVDLDAVVSDVLRDMEPDLEGRRIEWARHPLPTVHGDSTMLRVVLTNLLSNAVKYTRTRETAHVEIGASDADVPGLVKLWIRDDGIGFDMEYAHKLFGVFQRLHSHAEVEGTGIGLATVRRIVQRHGGEAWAESEEDHGATFYVTLPRAPGPAPSEDAR